MKVKKRIDIQKMIEMRKQLDYYGKMETYGSGYNEWEATEDLYNELREMIWEQCKFVENLRDGKV